MSKSTYKATVDEDVDDLDDVLSEFSKPAPASTSKAPQQQQAQQTQGEPEMDEAFLAELSKNMESLFSKNLAGGPEDGGPGDMKAFLEAMMRESGSDEAAGQVSQEEVDKAMKDLDAQLGKTAQPKEKGKASTSAAGFQEAIRQSMDKVNASDASARAQMNSSANADPLAALLANLENGLSDDPNLQNVLDQMMSTIMSKELLYEPIKDLNEKFPAYLEGHSSDLPAADLERYKKQHAIIQKISAKFEDPDYDESNTEQSAELVALMQEMQGCGDPPKELMGDLPAMPFGADGLPGMPPGGMGDCPQQ